MKNIFTTLIIITAYCSIGFSQTNKNTSLLSMTNKKPVNLNIAMGDEIGGGKMNVIPSLIVPGLGLWRVTGSPIWLAFAPVCYGLVGGGAMVRIKGKQEYNNYQDAKNPLDQNTYFESANNKKALGNKLLGMGTALWILQAGWTYIYGSYNDIYRARNANWKDKISMSGDFEPVTKSFSFTTTINLY